MLLTGSYLNSRENYYVSLYINTILSFSRYCQ
jgi:hypothetical protein